MAISKPVFSVPLDISTRMRRVAANVFQRLDDEGLQIFDHVCLKHFSLYDDIVLKFCDNLTEGTTIYFVNVDENQNGAESSELFDDFFIKYDEFSFANVFAPSIFAARRVIGSGDGMYLFADFMDSGILIESLT